MLGFLKIGDNNNNNNKEDFFGELVVQLVGS